MIAQLTGRFLYITPTQVLVDVMGVGYEVFISLNTFSAIQAKQEGTLFTFVKISEDSHSLYGFAEPAEKEMFVKLISVSGVGASTARMMLSSLKPEEVMTAIATSDVRTLEKVKGIGKKTAERLVLELKDKVLKSSVNTNLGMPSYNTIWTDALDALVALGIQKQIAEAGVQKAKNLLPDVTTVEPIIKQVLKSL